MKKTLKLLSLFLCILMITTLLVSCSGRKKGYPPVWTNEKKVVMKIGDYNVTYDFYKYLFLNSKYFYDNGDDSYWTKDGNDVEKIKDSVLESLKNTYAMFSLADQYEITITDQEKLDIESNVQSVKENYENGEWEKELEAAFMTEELFKFSLEVQQLESNLYDYMIAESSGIIKSDDESVRQSIATEFAKATHILFVFSNEKEEEEALKEANEVLEKLKSGEDFETLKDKYSDDEALKNNKDGYCFTHGEFGHEFEYTAFELEIGEMSEIVKSPIGYHIIKRLPIEEEYIDKNFETLRKQFITKEYYEMVDQKAEELSHEYKKEFSDIQLDTFN